MKKALFTFIVIYTLFFATTATGQSTHRAGEKLYDTTIALLSENNFKKTVILLRKDKYVITASLNNLKENLENWLSQNPHLGDDKQLLSLILDASKNKTKIDAEEIANKNHLTSRLEFRIADMLADGKCCITNQENSKMITTIRIQVYSYNCGPLCGDGGRRFFINNMLLLQTVEWIS